MFTFENIQAPLREILKPKYEEEDTIHDWGHVERLRQAALDLDLTIGVPCDVDVLQAGAYVHGLNGGKAEAILLELDLDPGDVHRITAVANESTRQALVLATTEGKILHDAHLLEGDDNFLVTRCLVIGTILNESLAQTAAFAQHHYRVSKVHCAFPDNEKTYRKRVDIAIDYFDSLARVL